MKEMNLEPNQQAEGALKKDTRVSKIFSEEADINKDGELGNIVGSIAVPEKKLKQMLGEDLLSQGFPINYIEKVKYLKYFYFVKWDKIPDKVGLILDFKIKELDEIDLKLEEILKEN